MGKNTPYPATKVVQKWTYPSLVFIIRPNILGYQW